MDVKPATPYQARSAELATFLSSPVKRSLSEEVVVSLRDAILSGKLGPGQRLREELLASSMNVSRGPVREAIQQLEREGLVLMSPRRGATVARLSRDDLDEVYSLRRVLERLAVQEAIRKADASHLATMQGVVDEMSKCVEHGISEQQAAELDTRFHQLLLEAAQHKRLLRSWLELRSQIHLLLLSRTVDKDFREHLVKSHAGLLATIRDRDETRALDFIEEHLKGSYERVLKSYKP
jgi:DNA-binding GntR family transcriptional regulator